MAKHLFDFCCRQPLFAISIENFISIEKNKSDSSRPEIYKSLGASRGIANPEIISSSGPGTDDVTKSQNVILRFGPKSHTNRGNRKIANADWEDKSSPSHCFCQWLASQIHIHICYWFIWEMMHLKPFEFFSSDMFPVLLKPKQTCNALSTTT